MGQHKDRKNEVSKSQKVKQNFSYASKQVAATGAGWDSDKEVFVNGFSSKTWRCKDWLENSKPLTPLKHTYSQGNSNIICVLPQF